MNVRLPLPFIVLPSGDLPGRGCSLAQPRCSELDTTEIEASKWSRASPEVARGRPRGADRWRAAWLAFPASSGGSGSTGEWGRAGAVAATANWLETGPMLPLRSRSRVVVSPPGAPGNGVPLGTGGSFLRGPPSGSGPLGSHGLHQHADRTSSVVPPLPGPFIHSFLACVVRAAARWQAVSYTCPPDASGPTRKKFASPLRSLHSRPRKVVL